jgi:hypothetical protein
MAAWEIDKGPKGFSVSMNFHDRGQQGSNYDIRRSGNTFSGRTSREVAVQNAIVAAYPGTVTSVSSVGPSVLGAMMSRQFTGTQFAALIVEGNSAAGVTGWRNFGAAIPQGIMTRVDAGDFALNLPDDPPPVEGWDVTGGVNELTIVQAESVTAPAVPTVTGGANQITITG